MLLRNLLFALSLAAAAPALGQKEIGTYFLKPGPTPRLIISIHSRKNPVALYYSVGTSEVAKGETAGGRLTQFVHPKPGEAVKVYIKTGRGAVQLHRRYTETLNEHVLGVNLGTALTTPTTTTYNLAVTLITDPDGLPANAQAVIQPAVFFDDFSVNNPLLTSDSYATPYGNFTDTSAYGDRTSGTFDFALKAAAINKPFCVFVRVPVQGGGYELYAGPMRIGLPRH